MDFLVDVADAWGELVNMIAGNLKALVPPPSQVSLPSVVEGDLLQRFTHGVWYQDEEFRAEKARLVSASHSQSLVELELAEGKYREVRRLFESQTRTVKRLQRIQIGKIKLGELRPGKWRTLTEPEIKSLLG